VHLALLGMTFEILLFVCLAVLVLTTRSYIGVDFAPTLLWAMMRFVTRASTHIGNYHHLVVFGDDEIGLRKFHVQTLVFAKWHYICDLILFCAARDLPLFIFGVYGDHDLQTFDFLAVWSVSAFAFVFTVEFVRHIVTYNLVVRQLDASKVFLSEMISTCTSESQLKKFNNSLQTVIDLKAAATRNLQMQAPMHLLNVSWCVAMLCSPWFLWHSFQFYLIIEFQTFSVLVHFIGTLGVFVAHIKAQKRLNE